MPDRVFMGFNQPPRMIDRITAHFAEIGLAMMGILFGMVSLFGSRSHIFLPAIDRLPDFFSVPTAALLMVGGGLWIKAVVTYYGTVNRYWFNLRWGLATSGFGWTGFFAAALLLRPMATITWIAALMGFIVTWVLYVLSFVQERSVRKRGSP